MEENQQGNEKNKMNSHMVIWVVTTKIASAICFDVERVCRIGLFTNNCAVASAELL